MNATHRTDDEQTKLWNGSAGCAWVDAQEMLDRTLMPLEELLIAEVRASGAARVLDVGCGTGSTTLAAARVLGADGRSVGIDISEPMIAAARGRAEQERSSATFICADAQSHAFGSTRFDLIIARFGVMFFDDPVQAFANLRNAMSAGGQLRSVVWRSAAENPFMTTAERAASALLPNLAPRRADAPGQFGFADAQRVRKILERSGLGGHRHPTDRRVVLAARERVGPLRNALRPGRHRSARGGPADARAGRSRGSRGIRALRAGNRSALYRVLLADVRATPLTLTHLRDLIEHVDESHDRIGDAGDLGIGRLHHVVLVGRVGTRAVAESEVSSRQRQRRRGEHGARP